MDWADERYVRVYTRDTAEWLALSWQARGLFCLVLRTCDRAGIIDLGRIGTRGLAALVHAPWKDIAEPLSELLEDTCVELHEHGKASVLVVPNFVEAQESTASSTQRSRESRHRRKDMARAEELARDETLHHKGTKRCVSGDETRPNATLGDAAGRDATPSVPCRAVPPVPDPPVVPPEGTPPKKKREPTTALPADFAPTAEHQQLARKHRVDIELELVKFKAHYEGKRCARWGARLTKWIANAATYKQERTEGTGGNKSERDWGETKAAEARGGRLPLLRPDKDPSEMTDQEKYPS